MERFFVSLLGLLLLFTPAQAQETTVASDLNGQICGNLAADACISWLNDVSQTQNLLISDAEEEIKRINAELTELRAGAGTTECTNAEVPVETAGPQTSCEPGEGDAALRETLAGVESERDELAASVKELESIVLRLSSVEIDLTAARARVSELEAQKTSLEDNLVAQANSLDQARDTIAQHEAKVASLEEEGAILRLLPKANEIVKEFDCSPHIDSAWFSQDVPINVYVQGADEAARVDAMLAQVKKMGLKVDLSVLPDVPLTGCPQYVNDDIGLLRWSQEAENQPASVFEVEAAGVAKSYLLTASACSELSELLGGFDRFAWVFSDERGVVMCDLGSGKLDLKRSGGGHSALVPIRFDALAE